MWAILKHGINTTGKKQIWEQIEMVLLNIAQIWNNWKAGQ